MECKDGYGFWTFGKLKCSICNYVYIAVYNLETEKVECPECGVFIDLLESVEFNNNVW